MTHLINRLQFELNCTDEDQAFNFRQNFAITFQEQIIDAADEICSNHVLEDEWTKIEKLEIDLGKFSHAAFDSNFTSVFKGKFEKALVDKLSNISSSQKKESLLVSKIELLKHFLQTGTLPWWATEQEKDINEIICEIITNHPKKITPFFYHHQFKKNLWTRVSFQLNEEAKTKLILLIPILKATKELLVKWIQQLNIFLKNENVAAMNVTGASIDNIILGNAPQIFQHQDDAYIYLEIFKNTITSIDSQCKPAIDKIISNSHSDFINVFNKMADDFMKENITAQTDAGLELKETNYQETAADKYTVKHAGIILLSPFLKTFFTNLQLLNGKEWKNKNSQYKSVHLLKFLSTGEQKTFEYNLTLEKIICGLNIEEPIPLEILLEEQETNEAIQLLESVIEHWKALKSTSVNGLRESFLKREGIITQKENGWLLQVERKTLDILIDSIPWGYSTITFPWNEYLIFVEW
jgi:hypothetical protein